MEVVNLNRTANCCENQGSVSCPCILAFPQKKETGMVSYPQLMVFISLLPIHADDCTVSWVLPPRQMELYNNKGLPPSTTTLAKKIVTAEKFMGLIDSAIMWYRGIASFDSTSTQPACLSVCVSRARVADRSWCRLISHDRTADQSHEYLGCNDFFWPG